jgi:hypothetical protein
MEEVKSRELGLPSAGNVLAMGLAVRKSHENPHVLKLYEEFLTDGPFGKVSHEYMHTHYTPRGDYLVYTEPKHNQRPAPRGPCSCTELESSTDTT